MNKTPHWNTEISVDAESLDRARKLAVATFETWEWMPPGQHDYLSIPWKGGHTSLEMERDLVLPFSFAERFFGTPLPSALIGKLTNPTQTRDTLFELVCLGLLSLRHKVLYEPRIASGKVPDMMVKLPDGSRIYVECKSHRLHESNYFRRFQEVTTRLLDGLEEQPTLKALWDEGSRCEFYLKGRPSDAEIESAKRTIHQLHPSGLRAACNLSPRVCAKAVPRSDGRYPGPSMWSGRMTVSTQGTEFSLKNTHLVAYSWPGLDAELLKTQRALLSEARRKLAGMPAGCLGLVCIQTLSPQPFLPHVRRLIDQQQFKRVPIIWINPDVSSGMASKIIFRDEARALVRLLLGPF